MPFSKSETRGGQGDDSINTRYQSLLKNMKKSAEADGTDFPTQPHTAPPKGKGYQTLTDGPRMSWTKMLEAMDDVSASLQAQSEDVGSAEMPEAPVEGEGTISGDNTDLLEELNRLYTPILVMQGIEKDIGDKVNAEIAESTVLTEKNMISFDEPSRMAQLISVCALLINQKKNSEKWQLYKKAAALKNQAKLDMQKDEYDAAKALAQAYLVKVSTTNNSSVARDAANELLPHTQH